MNLIATQQADLDNALVPSEKRLKIERCNARIAFTKPQKEEIYQVTLEALLRYLLAIWLSKSLMKSLQSTYISSRTRSKRLKKQMLMTSSWIIKSVELKLKYSVRFFRSVPDSLTKILWKFLLKMIYFHLSRNLVTLAIMKCFLLSVLIKCTSLGGRLLLLLTNFMYQADNREINSVRKEHIPYLRFTKVIINHSISKDNTISIKNKINLHTVHDDTLLGTLNFISKTEDYHKYRALIPDGMINQEIKDSKAYKTYLDYATRKVPPKKARKFKKHASPKLNTILCSPNVHAKKSKRVKRHAKESIPPTADVVIRDTPGASVSKKITPAKSDRGKDIVLLLDVPDEPTGKPKDTSKGTGEKPGVLDVSKDDSTDSEAESWDNSEEKRDDVNDEDDNDNDNKHDHGGNDDGGNEDDKRTESDNDENPSFTLKDYEEEETQEDEYMHTLVLDKSNDEEKVDEEENDEVTKELYEDLNFDSKEKDTNMSNVEQGGADQQNVSHKSGFVHEEDAHMTLKTVHDKTESPLVFAFEAKVSEFNQTSQFAEAVSIDCVCSKGNIEDKILVPKPPKNCARCGHPVDGLNWQGCALLQQDLEEDLVTHSQDRQNTFESSNDNTNVINAPREPFLHVCYDDDDDEERSDSLKDNIIFGLPSIFAITLNEPVLSIEEPDNSLSIGDEHLDTILATESDEVIKSSVKNLIPIPSESEGIPKHKCDVPSHDNSPPLDVSKDQFADFFESNDEVSFTDDDYFSIDNIDYVEASPIDSELVSSEVMEIVILEVRGIDDDILLTIKDDILHEKLLNVNLLIAKIEALNDNPTLSSDYKTKSSSTSINSLLEDTNTFDNSLPEFETFCFNVEEISSGSTTTHYDISLSEYEVFYDDHVKEISGDSPTTHYDSFLV
nr:hypothetical protein [Tanacetum cinerariifolium]GEW00224.1 hypothetical protein [Tanacetum cinerariifolium]